MVRPKIDLKNIEWFKKNPPLKEEDIALLKKLPFTLPKTYVELMKISDGGNLENTDFDYYDVDFEEIRGGGIGEIWGIAAEVSKMPNKYYDQFSDRDNEQNEFYICYHDIINNYYDPPEFFPKNLVAFGNEGGGNLICFDYRADPKTDNPPIIYWNFGTTDDKSISFIAGSFEEFLAMLRKYDDEDE